MHTCPECKAPAGKMDDLCRKCGAKLRATCPYCGAETFIDSNCERCKASLFVECSCGCLQLISPGGKCRGCRKRISREYFT